MGGPPGYTLVSFLIPRGVSKSAPRTRPRALAFVFRRDDAAASARDHPHRLSFSRLLSLSLPLSLSLSHPVCCVCCRFPAWKRERAASARRARDQTKPPGFAREAEKERGKRPSARRRRSVAAF